MPPLVVPTTVKSGRKPGACAINSSSAQIIIREARCNRFMRRPFPVAEINCSSGTCPAVLHRHSVMSNCVIGEMQSRAARNARNVSSKPSPSGLTIPADTTATLTWDWPLFTKAESDFSSEIAPLDSICFRRRGQFIVRAETEVREVGELSVEFIQWRFEIRLAGTVTEQRFKLE